MPLPERKTVEGDAESKRTLGKGVFRKCDGCGETMPTEEFHDNHEVCPACGHHHKLGAAGWRELLLDEGSFEEWDAHLEPADPLEFVDGKGYPDRVAAAQRSSRAKEAVEIGLGRMAARPWRGVRSSSRSWADRWAAWPARRSRG